MGATEPYQTEKLKYAAEQEVAKIIKLHESSNSYLDLVAKSIFQIPDALFRFPNLEVWYYIDVILNYYIHIIVFGIAHTHRNPTGVLLYSGL